MEKEVIGRRISGLLSERGLPQKDLAVAVGVHVNVVSYWCRSVRIPNIDQIVDVAKFFGVTTDYLLGLTDVSAPDMDMQALCDMTGLTADAAANLIRLGHPQEDEEPDCMPAVNAMLSKKGNPSRLAAYVYFLMEDCERAREYLNRGVRSHGPWEAAWRSDNITGRMELSFFKADEAFREAIDNAFDYRRIINDLRNAWRED